MDIRGDWTSSYTRGVHLSHLAVDRFPYTDWWVLEERLTLPIGGMDGLSHL